MKKEELLEALGMAESAEFTGKSRPRLVKKQEDDYSRLIQDGVHRGQPARLVIGLNSEIVDDNNYMYSDYRMCVNEDSKKAVYLPELLSYAYSGQCKLQVFERPIGRPIILTDNKGDLLAKVTSDQLKEVVEVYQATAEIADHLTIPQVSGLDYFYRQFRKWEKETDHGIFTTGMQLFDRQALMGKLILSPHDLSKLEMHYFFNVFGNTDIVRTDEGRYYLINGHLEAKPKHYGAAAWMWNALLYSHGLGWPVIWPQFQFFVGKLLNQEAGELWPAEFRLNMIERIYAAINVDCAQKRSPFDGLPEIAASNCSANLKATLAII